MSEPATPTTVLIVDTSPRRRRFLHGALEADPTVTVVADAHNATEGVALVEKMRPAVVLMQLDPRGVEAIEAIMADWPTPIVCYSNANRRDPALDKLALAAGAITILEEPAQDSAKGWPEYAEKIVQQTRVASRVRVITHPRGRLTSRRASGASSFTAKKLVVIGASTGGPSALADVLGALPADFEAAVLVVQHMADGFMSGLASYLHDLCALPVTVGHDGLRLRPGEVVLAPDGMNTTVHEQLRLTCAPPPEGQLHIPGIDVTFASVAKAVGPAAVGVLLTGMGRDGAVGLRAMRDRGALTIGQDQATSAVYGMPAAAVTAGAVEQELPLNEIGPAIVELIGQPVTPGVGP